MRRNDFYSFVINFDQMEPENELIILEKLSLEQVAAYIRDLIERDFQKLVNLLYRVDVSEDRIKTALENNHQDDAGTLIADLLMERLAQSRKAREQSGQRQDIPEDEKW